MPYVRNSIAYDHDFWYTCVKWWYLLVFFSSFFFWCWEGGNRAKTGFWYTCVKWYLQEFFSHFFKILIFQVFQSSSINAKRKFWGVPHLLHICVIFTYYLDKIEWIKCLKWWLQSYKAWYFNKVKFKNSSIMIFPIVIINIIFIVIINTIFYDAFNINVIKKKYIAIKGNPNFQGILNWIIQLLHYYCWKQHKNIKNSWIIEQNIAISPCSSLCLLRLVLPSPSSMAGYFQFLDTVLNVTSDYSCCI